MVDKTRLGDSHAKAVCIVEVNPSMTDEDLYSLVTEMYRHFKETFEMFDLVVGGFDADSRELADIPEAVALFKRLVACGMLCVCTRTTLLNPDHPIEGTLGAFEIWIRAEEKIPPRDSVTREVAIALLLEFDEAIPEMWRRLVHYTSSHCSG